MADDNYFEISSLPMRKYHDFDPRHWHRAAVTKHGLGSAGRSALKLPDPAGQVTPSANDRLRGVR